MQEVLASLRKLVGLDNWVLQPQCSLAIQREKSGSANISYSYVSIRFGPL